MKEKKKEEPTPKKKKKKDEKPLPFCTTAPSAEHSRASEDDGPCDDSRGTK